MRFLFTSIALSSVVLTTGFLEFQANALEVSSLFDLLQAVPNQENSEQSTDIDQSTDSVDSIEQAVPSQENSIEPSDSLASVEQAVHDQVNQYRASRGLPPLSLDSRISEQARAHSKSMASGAVPFSHDGFSQRVQTIAKVIFYNGAAENVAYNQGYGDPVTQAVQGWLNSTGHRMNIQGQYNLTGIGIAKNSQGAYYFTQIFIRSPSVSTASPTSTTPAFTTTLASVEPQVINVAKNAAYPKAINEMKAKEEFHVLVELRQKNYLNNITLARPSGDKTVSQTWDGFGSFNTA